MATPIAVFTGDNHLRPTTWAKHPDLYGDAYCSFQQIVAYCIEQMLPLILLGDLFDKARPDSLSVAFFLHQITLLREAGVPVYYVEGNHDKADPPWAAVSTYPQGISSAPIRVGGHRMVGIDYMAAGNLAEALAALPSGFEILVMHQSWLEIQRVGHVDGTFSMIPRGCTLLTGDYHVCGTYNGRAADGEQVIAHSPGSTSMQALNESPAKCFGILHDDLSVVWQELITRPFVNATARTEEEFAALIQNLETHLNGNPRHVRPPDIRKPILRFRYNDAIPEAYDRLVAAVGEAAHLFPEPQHEMDEVVIEEDVGTPAGAFDSLVTAVGELCDPGSDVYNGVRRLLEAGDPGQELAAMFEEYKQSHATQPGEDPGGLPPSPVV